MQDGTVVIEEYCLAELQYILIQELSRQNSLSPHTGESAHEYELYYVISWCTCLLLLPTESYLPGSFLFIAAILCWLPISAAPSISIRLLPN